MKKFAFVFFIGIVAFSGCNDHANDNATYMINEPVFMPAESFRKSVNITTQPVTICHYGKICFYDGYIYISETQEGVHIIDNRNPSHPRNAGFIELMGNADLAIRNGKLYADSFIDLVWFDISNPERPRLEGRVQNIFKDAVPLPDNEYGFDYRYLYNYDGSQGVIVGWKLKSCTEAYLQENNIWWGWGGVRRNEGIFFTDALASYSGAESSMKGVSGGVGVNGSMSRFALYRNYLYSVINNYMSVIDLSGDEPVKAAEDIYVGNVETIFSYKDNMFIGSPWGMTIYSVSNPLKPEYMSSVWHVFGCDPVVVEDDLAYVTIHAGNVCGQDNNNLIIYNVSDVRNPQLIVSYDMTKPKGLGIDNGTLFVCDDGLKIFNASNPKNLLNSRLAHYTGMEGFDVIPFDNVLMMIAEDGLYQYDYSNLRKIRRLSKLPIVNNCSRNPVSPPTF